MGLLVVLVLGAFVAMLALRIIPIYLESMTVASVVSDVADNPELGDARPGEVRSALMRQLQVNNVDKLGRNDISVERSGEGVAIVVAYERRFPLIANLDGIASFREEALVQP
ncbi:protein of unknown function [Aquisalimonas asiatica]|uniref:DUF4845 domain-containing protein n=1 Tax=Aquisalimonas asiatica TaxID=406100 RepID=A0A1H8QCU4_9GAMM|nr:protein of unknown function [Aquisalimonas asiatica]